MRLWDLLKPGFAANDMSMHQKSTATVTWTTYRNFGTYLQAYALQKAVVSLGDSNRIIDDGKIVSSFPVKKFSPLRMLRNIGWIDRKRDRFRCRSLETFREFDDFKTRYLDMDADWSDKKDLASRYGAYIAGSDQIWSPNVRFDDFYYLAFTDRPKVSYAPSFGASAYPEERAALVRSHIERFSCLSVREPQGAAIMNDTFGLQAEIVADPTMLLERKDWECLIGGDAGKDESERPYVLCYLLTYNRRYIDFVKDYCRRNSLDMKVVVVSPDFVGISDNELYTGPAGFLKAVRDAETVMTDSFHGTIFSLIFEKEFYTFKRFSDDSVLNQNSRLEHLLSEMGLIERFMDEKSIHVIDNDVDHVSVGQRIARMREKSMRYLKDSLETV